MKIYLLNLTFLIHNLLQALVNGQLCPFSCSCNILETTQTLKIECSAFITGGGVIALPALLSPSNTKLQQVIVVKSGLLEIPQNLCLFFYTDIRTLDLSHNRISHLSGDSLACAVSLQTLNLSHNLIFQIAENAFINLNHLVTLDLSFNLIRILPTFLFVSPAPITQRKLPNLKYLYLQNNQLVTLDPWFFYLPGGHAAGLAVNLASNQIKYFSNDLGFSVSNGVINAVGRNRLACLDLSFNQIERFDDQLLTLYQVTSTTDMAALIQYMYNTSLAGNPLFCTCANSLRMQSLIGQLISNQVLNQKALIFQCAVCSSASREFSGLSALYFSNTCPTSTPPATSTAQSTAATLTTSASKPHRPEFQLCPLLLAILAALLFILLLVSLITTCCLLFPLECRAFEFFCCPCIVTYAAFTGKKRIRSIWTAAAAAYDGYGSAKIRPQPNVFFIERSASNCTQINEHRTVIKNATDSFVLGQQQQIELGAKRVLDECGNDCECSSSTSEDKSDYNKRKNKPRQQKRACSFSLDEPSEANGQDFSNADRASFSNKAKSKRDSKRVDFEIDITDRDSHSPQTRTSGNRLFE